MSDYPSYRQLREGSQPQLSLPHDQMSSVNGSPLTIVRGSGVRRKFPLRHRLTDAQFQTILTLFRSVQRVGQQPYSFTFTSDFDSVEYTVVFGSRPSRVKIGPDLYDVTLSLLETDS